ARDIEGVDITLLARTGSIGTETNFLEINLLDTVGIALTPVSGILNALAKLGIYIFETIGDLRVGLVDARQNDATKVTDVALVTHAGSILDGQVDTAADVIGDRIDLRAAGGGGIGVIDKDLDVNTGVNGPTSGRLYAEADASIFATETQYELRVLAAKSWNGNVRLTVPDTNGVRGPPNTDPRPRTEDLTLLVAGDSLVSENQPRHATPGAVDSPTSTRTGIWAKLDISLWIGDDLSAPALSDIVAGGTVYIHGDVTRTAASPTLFDPDPLGTPDAANADTHSLANAILAGFGTTMTFAGRLGGVFDLGGANDRTDAALVFGHIDVDRFDFLSTLLGTAVHVYGSQNLSATDETRCTLPTLQIACGDGEDQFLVRTLRTPDIPSLHTLTLDGQQGTDHYRVETSTDVIRTYTVNLLDTGAPDDGADVATVVGTDGADIFLLRRVRSIPGETADHPAFVALIHASEDALRGSPAGGTGVERINYDAALNGRLVVIGGNGADLFAVDDTSATITLDGGAGADRFQIGQLFGTPRDASAGLSPADIFPTLIPTTRGYLSPGISAPLLALGGEGDDQFTVYSNQAELRLEGEDGNDFFIVRAFALARTNPDGT
ncbi:MAG TPA: hypothetical protein VL916_07650, partial [Ilumatobacteraceae bacterium]|nr:hypothetical protein [Ilumatobacteraceae bacterium]